MSNLSLIDATTDTQTLIDLLRLNSPLTADLSADSRAVQVGDVFVACAGVAGDGRRYVADAVSRGAAVVLIDVQDEDERLRFVPNVAPQSAVMLGVVGLKQRLGELADAWYGRPSTQLHVVAITGTNGKTSCVSWLAQALNALGLKAGTIGTLGVSFPDGHIESGQLTTPDVISVHRALARLRAAGAEYVAIEASSIGIEQGRLDGVRLAVAAFTNLSHDHLDYHGDMKSYEAAKRALFDWPDLTRAVINIEDEVGQRFAHSLRFKTLTYSTKLSQSAEVQASTVQLYPACVRFTLHVKTHTESIEVKVVGQHNISNLLCVAGVLSELGVGSKRIVQALASLSSVDGRLQYVEPAVADDSLPTVVVDYAHTPDALQRVLTSLLPLAHARGGKLWCVFGCGGDRDAAKRPLMGRIAAEAADYIVLTNDNPRNESAQLIIEQIRSGIPVTSSNVAVEAERPQAILTTIFKAESKDLVLLAGKGHETYQEIGNVRHPFDDRQWARAGLLLRQAPSIQTDSRKLIAGEVFLALRGEQFDGHEYVQQVAQAGASAAVVAEPVDAVNIPQIALGDTRAALLQIGKAWRSQFNIPMIAVTGSNGKTTTKEMISSVLAAWLGADHRLATQGNLNNDLGVPLTLLRLRPEHRAAVIELGMNHPGEISIIAGVTEPTVALVNNAQREHQEFMTTIEAVAIENGQVFLSLPKDGIAVFPATDEYSTLWGTLAGERRQVSFGLQPNATVYATDLETDAFGSVCHLHTPAGDSRLTLAVPGIHNVRNALAAAACCLAAGAPLSAVVQGLAAFNAVKGRMQPHRLDSDRILIDDTYNANPDSVRAAIDVLAGMKSPTLLVLGDMGEVGDNGPAMHQEVGAYARQQGINHLITLGEATQESARAFGADAMVCDSVEAAVDAIQSLKPLSLVIKGSRFMRMERIVSRCLDLTGAAHGDRVQHAV